VVTCEHASNHIPAAYLYYFEDAKSVLKTHRAIDIGALVFFQKTIQNLDVSFSKYGKASRLLVELNRTIGNKQLFSEYSNNIPQQAKDQILAKYYHPYRNEVTAVIQELINQGFIVIHLSVHSFTPILNGEERLADVGLLFDSSSDLEKTICRRWQKEIQKVSPEIMVKLNYPYLGIADGFTTFLRKKFTKNYAGLELELNQKHFKKKEWPSGFFKIINAFGKQIL
jgi:predicted N-formylglutamate amidohydrolase